MKLSKVFAFASIALVFGMTAANAADYGNVCVLIQELGNVFRVLRTLAFAGAAFVLAGWAWKYITTGWGKSGDGGTDLEATKKQGIGMLIGFILLFGIGMIMQFLPNLGENCLPDW